MAWGMKQRDKSNSVDGLGYEIVDDNNSADGLGHESSTKKVPMAWGME